jgi:hypothetical protein
MYFSKTIRSPGRQQAHRRFLYSCGFWTGIVPLPDGTRRLADNALVALTLRSSPAKPGQGHHGNAGGDKSDN